MDILLKREELLTLTNSEVLASLQEKYLERKLYSISLDWRKDEKYILKARGTSGDLIVGWSDKK